MRVAEQLLQRRNGSTAQQPQRAHRDRAICEREVGLAPSEANAAKGSDSNKQHSAREALREGEVALHVAQEPVGETDEHLRLAVPSRRRAAQVPKRRARNVDQLAVRSEALREVDVLPPKPKP